MGLSKDNTFNARRRLLALDTQHHVQNGLRGPVRVQQGQGFLNPDLQLGRESAESCRHAAVLENSLHTICASTGRFSGTKSVQRRMKVLKEGGNFLTSRQSATVEPEEM